MNSKGKFNARLAMTMVASLALGDIGPFDPLSRSYHPRNFDPLPAPEGPGSGRFATNTANKGKKRARKAQKMARRRNRK